jgi:hypothetical protein
MSKEKKPLSRWNTGNERYTKDQLDYIYRHYHEQPGWRKGAKVYRR